MFNVRQKIIDRAINHNKRKVVFPSLEAILSVGFVLDSDMGEEAATWNYPGVRASVKSIRYVNQKRGNDNFTNVIFRSDLNLWKLPPDKLLRPFIETPFDLLINLAGINNDTVTYICAASKAKFKVSYKPHGKIFDLVIDLVEENKSELVTAIINTLTKLKNRI